MNNLAVSICFVYFPLLFFLFFVLSVFVLSTNLPTRLHTGCVSKIQRLHRDQAKAQDALVHLFYRATQRNTPYRLVQDLVYW